MRVPSAPQLDVTAQLDAWRALAGSWESDLPVKTEVAQLRRARRSRRKVEL